MSRLDELINEFCPDGVEYKAICEFCKVGTGKSNRQDADENGEYPFYVRSKEVFLNNSYEFDEEAIIIPGEGSIGEIFHYVNGKYALHQRAYRIHIEDNYVITKFLYYYMAQNFKKFIYQKAVNATVKSIRKPMIEKFVVPIPPLPVQREIVRILDNFTELTAELTEELTARKKQYEYYRNSLLRKVSFVEYRKIKDCFQRLRGTAITAGKMKEIGCEAGEIRVFAGGKTVVNANEKDIPNANIIRVPAVFVQSRGVIDVIYFEKPFTFKNEMWAYTHSEKTTVKYLFYFLKNNIQQFRSSASGMGSLPQISLPVTEDFLIPIPPLKEQERIVAILDKFDTLTTSISEGLPAEIEARKQQYEYYRDNLLNFEKIDIEVLI